MFHKINKILSCIILSLYIYSGVKAQKPKIVFPFEGHIASIHSAVFSPDGKSIYTASGSSVKRWDLPSGRLISDFYGDGYNSEKDFVNISPNGALLYIQGLDPALFEIKTGKRISYLSSKTEESAYVKGNDTEDKNGVGSFSPDSRKIVTTSGNYTNRNYTAKIWNSRKGILLKVLKGHTQRLNSVQFSPDGKRIITGSSDSTAKVWDATTGKLLFTLKQHKGEVTIARFSSDNKNIITVGLDTCITNWDAVSGAIVSEIRGHGSLINAVSFSPDGTKVVSCSYDGSAKVSDLRSGNLVREFKENEWVIYTAVFSPDGSKILTASGDGGSRVWDMETRKLLFKNFNSTTFYENFAFFSPDGKTIATPSDNAGVAVWDFLAQKLIVDITNPCLTPFDASFSKDGSSIVAAFSDGKARVWDINNGRITQTFKKHTRAIHSLAISRTKPGKAITTSWDSTAKIWDVSTGKMLLNFKTRSSSFNTSEFSPDGKKIITTSGDSSIQLWDANTGSLLMKKKINTSLITAKFTPDGKKIISIGGNDITLIWTISNNIFSLPQKWPVHPMERSLQDLVFSPDGTKVILMTYGNYEVWDFKTDTLLFKPGYFNRNSKAVFSPDGNTIVILDYFNKLAFFKSENGERLYYNDDNSHTGSIYSINYSPDGAMIVTTSEDNTIKLRDAKTGQLKYSVCITGGSDYLVVAPDERYDGTIAALKKVHFSCDNNIVDTKGFKELCRESDLVGKIMGVNKEPFKATIPGDIPNCSNTKETSVEDPDLKLVLPISHTGRINTAKFSPDGKRVITSSNDKSAKVWDVQTGKQIADFRNKESVTDAIFLEDGQNILVGGKYAEVYSIRSGKRIDYMNDNVKSISAFADGRRMLSLSSSTLILSVLDSGDVFKKEVYNYGYINAIVSPDEKKIACLLQGGDIEILSALSGDLLAKINDRQYYNNDLCSPAFSIDGKTIITGGTDTVKVWDAQMGGRLINLIGHRDLITSLSFSPDGKKIISSSEDSTVKIWDFETGKLLLDLTDHANKLKYGGFSPDSKKIITFCKYNSEAKLWDADTGIELHNITGHTEDIQTAEFSKDSRLLVTASDDETAKIWDVQSGRLLQDLRGHTQNIESAIFSPNGKKIIHNSGENSARIWDWQTGVLQKNLLGKIKPGNSTVFSPDGKKIITVSRDTATIREFETYKILNKLSFKKNSIATAVFSPDGKRILIISGYELINMWDAETNQLLFELKFPGSLLIKANFSPNSQRILTYSLEDTTKVWDAQSGALISEMKYDRGRSYSASFSPDSKKIVSAFSYSAIIWDVETGKVLSELKVGWSMESASFSADGKKILTLSAKNAMTWDAESGQLLDEMDETDYIRHAICSPDNKYVLTSGDSAPTLWNLENGELVMDFYGQRDINSISFSPDGSNIVTTSRDNTAKLWNIEKAKHIYSFFAIDSTDYFLQIPSGYYQCNANAAKLLHYVSKDLKVISFEQLDVKYNRPDKVLEAIGSTDTALIQSYRRAYEKRIKKLGIDTTSFKEGFDVPEADFKNRDSIKYEQKKGDLVLHVKGIDSTYKLDRVNVWVNEVPVYGQRGITVRTQKVNNFDSSLIIQLSQGENKIETSIANVNGTESYRMPLLVNYTPPDSQTTKTYFIGIGIDEFAQSKFNLKYSTKDIRDLSKKLKEKYKDIIIDTLFNEEVTISNIKALKQKLLQTSVNDKVIISYSGHGMLSKEFDYYLSTYAVNFDKPEENGLSYDELESLLDSIPARKKLMLIDACHSGEVDKEDLIALNATDKKLIRGLKPVAYNKKGQLGLKNSFELMQSLFVNVGKSTGATIISAAAGTEFALEGIDNLPNGVFTYCILEAMNKYPSMKISELKKIVGERVVQLTKGLQKPTSRNETIAVDWEL